jgi:hypothetical protein
VPLVAWAVLGERPGAACSRCCPWSSPGSSSSPARSSRARTARPDRGRDLRLLTGLTYAGFILVLRHSSADRRPPPGPLLDVTLAPAATTLAGGLVIGDLHFVPTWPGHAWLVTLALTSQIIGWLDLRLAAAAARRGRLDAADDPADRRRRARRDHLRRGPDGAAVSGVVAPARGVVVVRARGADPDPAAA